MYFDDLKIGMTVETAPAVIEKEKMMAFAFDYDNIPLHTDEEYAKSTRFGGLIAPGVMSFLCVWAKYLEVDFFGEELIAGMSTKIEWFRPVFAADTLTAEAEITKLTKRNDAVYFIHYLSDKIKLLFLPFSYIHYQNNYLLLEP